MSILMRGEWAAVQQVMSIVCKSHKVRTSSFSSCEGLALNMLPAMKGLS